MKHYRASILKIVILMFCIGMPSYAHAKVIPEKPLSSNPYERLGLTEDATQDEIKKQFRKLAFKYNTDMGSKLDAEYASIVAAYQELYENSTSNIDRRNKNLPPRRGAYQASTQASPPPPAATPNHSSTQNNASTADDKTSDRRKSATRSEWNDRRSSQDRRKSQDDSPKTAPPKYEYFDINASQIPFGAEWARKSDSFDPKWHGSLSANPWATPEQKAFKKTLEDFALPITHVNVVILEALKDAKIPTTKSLMDSFQKITNEKEYRVFESFMKNGELKNLLSSQDTFDTVLGLDNAKLALLDSLAAPGSAGKALQETDLKLVASLNSPEALDLMKTLRESPSAYNVECLEMIPDLANKPIQASAFKTFLRSNRRGLTLGDVQNLSTILNTFESPMQTQALEIISRQNNSFTDLVDLARPLSKMRSPESMKVLKLMVHQGAKVTPAEIKKIASIDNAGQLSFFEEAWKYNYPLQELIKEPYFDKISRLQSVSDAEPFTSRMRAIKNSTRNPSEIFPDSRKNVFARTHAKVCNYLARIFP